MRDEGVPEHFSAAHQRREKQRLLEADGLFGPVIRDIPIPKVTGDGTTLIAVAHPLALLQKSMNRNQFFCGVRGQSVAELRLPMSHSFVLRCGYSWSSPSRRPESKDGVRILKRRGIRLPRLVSRVGVADCCNDSVRHRPHA